LAENAEKSKPTRSLELNFHLPPATRPFDSATTRLFCGCDVAAAPALFDFLALRVFLDSFMCFLDFFIIANLAALPPAFHLPPLREDMSSPRFRLTETPREKWRSAITSPVVASEGQLP
jgi:hypothetical protein